MALLIRAALLLAVTVPLFAATHFHTPLWQILVAAAIGSGLGQLAVRVTRGRPRWIQVVIAACGLLVAAGAAVYFFSSESQRAPAKRHMIVVTNGTPLTLTLDDATALQRVAEVAAIAPNENKNGLFVTEAENWSTQVYGTTPSYLDVRGWRVARGAPFSQDDVDQAAKVVVLGPTTANRLFGNADPVGQTVKLRPGLNPHADVPMTVVGVIGDTGNPDDDDRALVPLSSFQRIFVSTIHFGGRFGGRFLILLRDGATSDPIRASLRIRHRLAPNAEDDFVLHEPN